MPKRSSKKLDPVQNARRVVLESIERTETLEVSMISQVMAEMGRRGGQIGGKRRLQTMTDEERKLAASNAAKARWSKKKPAKKS
jgi:hypothetical protein